MTTLKASQTRIPPDAFSRVAYRGERIRIERRGGKAVYLVCQEDLELLEQLEDRMDLEVIRERLNEPTIPLDELRKELGL